MFLRSLFSIHITLIKEINMKSIEALAIAEHCFIVTKWQCMKLSMGGHFGSTSARSSHNPHSPRDPTVASRVCRGEVGGERTERGQ